MKRVFQFISTCLLSSILLAPIVSATSTDLNSRVTQHQEMTAPNQVNINTANAEQLQKVLIGIGSKKAEAIIQYREKFGAFHSVEQLLEVSGFGQATLEKNRERILLE